MDVSVPVAPDDFCRQVESYLCRKNDGHLIRIVGPAFEQVCTWAARGIPLRVAFRGIDRTFERYYAKGPRRRPLRIEFCEADILDVFDEWRRAIGIPIAAAADPAASPEGGSAEDDRQGSRHHASLPAHLERVVARLTALRAGEDRRLDDVLAAIVRELDGVRPAAKSLRGPAREGLRDRLRALDATLASAAKTQCDPAILQELAGTATLELAAFRERMPRDDYAQAHAACVDRLVRERFNLPTIAYEG